MSSPINEINVHNDPINDLEVGNKPPTEPSNLEIQAKNVQNYLEQSNSNIHVVKSYSPDHNLQPTGLNVNMLANQAKKKAENVQEVPSIHSKQFLDDFIHSKVFAIMSKMKINEIRKNINKYDNTQRNEIIVWSKNQINMLTIKLNKTTHKELTSIIQETITRHKELIKHPPPPLMPRKIKKVTIVKDNSLIGNVSGMINKCVDWFFRFIQPVELKNLNILLGKYKQVSAQDFSNMKKIFSDENFSTGYQQMSGKNTPSLKAFYHLIDELKLIQEEQISRLNNGKKALDLSDLPQISLSISVFISMLDVAISMNNSEIEKSKLMKAKTVMIDMRDSSFAFNNQLGVDKLFPTTVIDDINSLFLEPKNDFEVKIKTSVNTGTVRRGIKNTKNRNNIPNDGFLSADEERNYRSKADWQGIDTNETNGAFMKGFRRIILQTPDKKHEITSGATLDLSPLGDDLTKKQVAQIFYFIFIYARGGIVPKKDENNRPELSEDQRNFLEYMDLSDDQKTNLITIVDDFNLNLSNAITLALISLGHKQASSEVIEEIVIEEI